MEDKQISLIFAARLLGYPEDDFPETARSMLEAAREAGSPLLTERLQETSRPLLSCPLKELREQYVWAFDWKEKTGLYLTAHELGDSRERGAALILLQQIIKDAGFAAAEGELADYMPLLYEPAGRASGPYPRPGFGASARRRHEADLRAFGGGQPLPGTASPSRGGRFWRTLGGGCPPAYGEAGAGRSGRASLPDSVWDGRNCPNGNGSIVLQIRN